MFYFDPMYFIVLAPALLLGMWAQWRLRSTFAQAQREPTRVSGAEAARAVLRRPDWGIYGSNRSPGRFRIITIRARKCCG